MLNTTARKFSIAAVIALGSVVWLNYWHEYGYSSAPLEFPTWSLTWRWDALIVFLPVLIVIWLGTALNDALLGRVAERMSASSQAILAATLLSVFSTIAVVLVEASRRLISTGISVQLSFVASLCTRLYLKGNLLLSFIKWLIPDSRYLRVHFLVQDGINLVLMNLALIIIVGMLMEALTLLRTERSFWPEVNRAGTD